jgi:predicted RNase H-like HicB family nuclease
MQPLIFEVKQELDGGYVAEALCESIFTQGNTLEELRFNISEAVEGFYFDCEKPLTIGLLISPCL